MNVDLSDAQAEGRAEVRQEEETPGTESEVGAEQE